MARVAILAAVTLIISSCSSSKDDDVHELVKSIKAGYVKEKASMHENPNLSEAPCKEQILSVLHDPFSAYIEYSSSSEIDDKTISSTFNVRAKNGFNAYRLSAMKCTLSFNGTSWSVASVEPITDQE